ncbi:MAG: hypothetical protein QHI38_09035 [Armatimonadota bacterium]|nr:hypothetical protein [Armatimonadota bacterium]
MRLESFETPRYQLDIELDDSRIRKIALKCVYSGVRFADSEYRYSAFVECGSRIFRLEGLYEADVGEEPWRRGGQAVTIRGILGNDAAAPRVAVRHVFYIPEDDDYFDEQITLSNQSPDEIVIRGYRFGFRKRLAKPKKFGGPGLDVEDYRLIAIPFRLQPDGKKHDYPLDDIYHGRYECSAFHNPARLVQEVVDIGRGRSEAWAWSNGENGLLIIKYNPEAVEYSMVETECREEVDPSGKPVVQAYLNFGGAAPSLYNEPIQARILEPGGEFTFGTTCYRFYEGLWRQGSYLFREYMSAKGHTFPENYNPPINWNELYDIGWYHNDRSALAQHYTAETLEGEAKKARDLGCDLLYLDPGWEVCEGTTIWDEARLGKPKEFIENIREKFGLKVGFRTIGRSYDDAWQGMYRMRFDGTTGYYAPYAPKPFYEPCFCSEAYQEEKVKRIVEIARAGMSFIMFDEFDWRGPCYDPAHGHPVPTTPDMHARAVAKIARKVREECPWVTIELHDPVWPWGVRYLPVYYMHNENGAFQELWAFEFMWNPLEDLLSGKAISLFYYNLAYSIPLYIHLDMANDNDNCLAFWWYASTCRHIGVGGARSGTARFEAYKKALAEYRSLKDLYARGTFYGPDELTHIHVLPEEGRCVVNAFNLTDAPISRTVEIRLHELGLLEELEVQGAPHQIVRGKLVLDLHIPPFSPVVVKMLPR